MLSRKYPCSNKIDQKVIISLKKGNKDAFKKVYDLYVKRVYHLAVRLGLSHEEAEGIVQEVFLVIWNQRKTIDLSLSFNAYIMTIAKRSTINAVRSNLRRNKYQQEFVHIKPAATQNTEEYIIFSDMMEHAQNGLDQLPARKKQIFMLSRQQGLSNEEIAEKLNLSPRTVENQLYRATKMLKNYIQPKDAQELS